jgi:hypothetical protein
MSAADTFPSTVQRLIVLNITTTITITTGDHIATGTIIPRRLTFTEMASGSATITAETMTGFVMNIRGSTVTSTGVSDAATAGASKAEIRDVSGSVASISASPTST